MPVIKCQKCGQEKEHQAKGYCRYCYKKFIWKPRVITCKRCQREMPLQAKGLCRGCYNFVFHLDDNKAFNYKKWHNIEPELYKKITQKCIICGFDKVVDLHHLNEDKKDNSEKNLIGLCPNHHKMVHNFTYRAEVFEILKQSGFLIPEDKKLIYMHKRS